MGLATGDESSDAQLSNAPEEKILVSVRLRPLNEREIENNDVPDWECINKTTILFKNNPTDRSLGGTAYAFDRVFGSDSSTREVYDEAAKSVALSVMGGVNSSIFAYGQTSSGKTYTMSGVTEYTVADIYDYIDKHPNREFVLKFSAMEIYNEAVRDLLSGDCTPLRLLDDPERGTVIEKLTEVTLRDQSHLKELLSVCEAERRIGETSMNEMSSRSHQILRLTISSCAREFKSYQNSSTLAASVHFVDLAGSERASQTLSAGARLKEGCHINRSLLALGTVIRKLSKGRNGHVPYRDSKLTRILQHSLGGNARTAIICTMCPAHSHVEQSRNTLLFASCAKQVSTNAHVNVVMSEKALVKQLQRELARLENQLKNLSSLSSSCDSLKEKELLIEKMDKEIRELILQRDQAHSRLQDLMQTSSEYQVQRGPWDEVSSFSGSHEKSGSLEEYAASEVSEILDPSRLDMSSLSHFPDRNDILNSSKHEDLSPEPSEEQFLVDDTSPRMFMEKYFGPDPTKGWEKVAQRTDPTTEEIPEENCKEVQCIETEVSAINLQSETVSSPVEEEQGSEDVKLDNEDENLEPKAEEVQENIDHPVTFDSMEQSGSSSDTEMSNSTSSDELSSTSCREIRTTDPLSPRPQIVKVEAKTPSSGLEKSSLAVQEGNNWKLSEPEPEPEPELEPDVNLKTSFETEFVDEKNIKSTVVNETSEKLEKVSDNALDKEHDSQPAPSDWSVEFERQRREIIELWDACHIPLVHRTSFFLLFKGDQSDSIYMEVELRRLSFLRTSKGTKNDQVLQQSSSTRTIDRERHMLSKLMLKKLSSKEREALFEKWGIGLKTKQRRLQLARLVWRNTKDMEHIKESAELVAQLVGFEKTDQTLREMVGLSFSAPSINSKSSSWKSTFPSLI